MSSITATDILFEVQDVLGKKIRTTKAYWNKIFSIKHAELKTTKEVVVAALQEPDEIRKSIQDDYIFLFYKKEGRQYLVIVIKYLNGNGFIVTLYKTSNITHKGELIWQK